MERLKVIEKERESIAMFSRGSDVVLLEIFRIMMKEKTRWFCINDFGNKYEKPVLRKQLNNLIKKGVVVKLKTHPVFYKIKPGY